jgi:hypothetical protein
MLKMVGLVLAEQDYLHGRKLRISSLYAPHIKGIEHSSSVVLQRFEVATIAVSIAISFLPLIVASVMLVQQFSSDGLH